MKWRKGFPETSGIYWFTWRYINKDIQLPWYEPIIKRVIITKEEKILYSDNGQNYVPYIEFSHWYMTQPIEYMHVRIDLPEKENYKFYV